MNTTKVVQINSECGRGSTGKIAVAISKMMTEHGVENYILYSGNHKSDYPLGRMIAGKYSIRIHQLLSRVFGDQGFHSYFATKKLIRDIERISPDAILLHNLHGYYLNLNILFAFLRTYGRPVYWTLHDCWAFTGHCTHFLVEKCEKWKTGCYKCGQKRKYPYSWFFDKSEMLFQRKKELFTSINNMTLIAPSEWLAALLRESFLKMYPITVINNGIDLSVFKPTNSHFREKHQIRDKRIILGVASAWSFYKGLDVFIELAHRLDASKYQVVLVGTDSDIDKQLPGSIISIHRTQSQRELAEIYTVADVFVNPTREDTYPTVNMEALACGTPVITFDTGGSGEIVNRGFGAVLKSNSIDELERTIYERFDHISEPRMENRSADCFDEKACFRQYVDLICT